jgi:hypothetical protein
VTAVVKSGDNEYRGGGFWAGRNTSFQGNSIDRELEAVWISSGDALDSKYDVKSDSPSVARAFALQREAHPLSFTRPRVC